MGQKSDKISILLPKPNTSIINEFVAEWKGQKNSKKFIIKIENKTTKEIEKWNLWEYETFGMDFEAIRKEEKLLDEKFKHFIQQATDSLVDLDESVTIEVVRLLDAIYSTRLDNATRFAMEVHKLIKGGLLEEIQRSEEHEDSRHAAECVDCIASICENNPPLISHNAYSFATKFCNRINPSRFPIYDSYVDSLLWYYHSEQVKFKRQELKDYKMFIKIYDKYREQWGIDSNINYKHIDIFMWTFGKAIKKSQDLKMDSSGKYNKLKENKVLEKIKKRMEKKNV